MTRVKGTARTVSSDPLDRVEFRDVVTRAVAIKSRDRN